MTETLTPTSDASDFDFAVEITTREFHRRVRLARLPHLRHVAAAGRPCVVRPRTRERRSRRCRSAARRGATRAGPGDDSDPDPPPDQAAAGVRA